MYSAHQLFGVSVPFRSHINFISPPLQVSASNVLYFVSRLTQINAFLSPIPTRHTFIASRRPPKPLLSSLPKKPEPSPRCHSRIVPHVGAIAAENVGSLAFLFASKGTFRPVHSHAAATAAMSDYLLLSILLLFFFLYPLILSDLLLFFAGEFQTCTPLPFRRRRPNADFYPYSDIRCAPGVFWISISFFPLDFFES